ncbi:MULTISPECIES: hypothetical protein [Pedobacter]|uniref:Uncharacterized protein n=1 Tax=Pedobacter heparinus (strain ATCC 13125 / DSM 2366 / CIP 104194 / JCM 7457 / NBRC 12017 / NCIMB 9290 / NRRL B-14731 / HIM 762-3) TaxID=485917 RepID=C6Y2X9_PEDHD|nr:MULTISPECIES: hypothetical protein [Pedobacter]ACU03192.1 hypothetical protein Phep_0970 [Pedobacter heparinus DSM 2366]MBB5438606.1 hypothetical protein [Pedobacter sp. AK017]
MLKILSYLNIALALAYFFGYLLNSYSWPIVAILIVIVFNGMVLRHLENEKAFNPVHYVLAFLNMVFAIFLSIWAFHILQSSIEHNYFVDSGIYLGLTTLFVLSIMLHLLLLFRKQY